MASYFAPKPASLTVMHEVQDSAHLLQEFSAWQIRFCRPERAHGFALGPPFQRKQPYYAK
jgi:hypothetical protein